MRLGFTEIVLPRQNLKNLHPVKNASVTGVDTLMQALAIVH
jgi:hypothetical protein